MNDIQRLKKDYPWIQTPLVIGAPMRLIALADMAVEISKAGMHMPLPFFIPGPTVHMCRAISTQDTEKTKH